MATERESRPSWEIDVTEIGKCHLMDFFAQESFLVEGVASVLREFACAADLPGEPAVITLNFDTLLGLAQALERATESLSTKADALHLRMCSLGVVPYTGNHQGTAPSVDAGHESNRDLATLGKVGVGADQAGTSDRPTDTPIFGLGVRPTRDARIIVRQAVGLLESIEPFAAGTVGRDLYVYARSQVEREIGILLLKVLESAHRADPNGMQAEKDHRRALSVTKGRKDQAKPKRATSPRSPSGAGERKGVRLSKGNGRQAAGASAS